MGGVAVGLVVSKAIGNSVIRHRTARRLRAILADVVGDLPHSAEVVVRALPPIVDANPEALRRDVVRALAKAQGKIRVRGPATPSAAGAAPEASSVGTGLDS